MSLILEQLQLRHFRNYPAAELNFEAPEVVFCGSNGSGKSNLLEAIFFLSILRSFRTGSIRELVELGERGFRLRGLISRGAYREELAVEQQLPNGRRLLIDGEVVRRSSEFIREFRAVAFAPEDKFITSGGSMCRRKFFDMFIAVMEPRYLVALQRYGAALLQRNAALRNPRLSEATLAAFEPELAAAAAVIVPLRRQYLAAIVDEVKKLPGGEDFNGNYKVDYPETMPEYLEKLATERERDRKRGYTTFGPQTDEFTFLLQEKSLRNFGSNGQLRLMSLYLKMAEFTLVRRGSGSGVVALVDDVTGELDEDNRERFLALLGEADQTFYTFTSMPADGRLRQAQRVEISAIRKQ